MSKNKILVLVAVAVLSLTLVIAGSIAFLTQETDPVTNEFVAAQLITGVPSEPSDPSDSEWSEDHNNNPNGDLQLKEHAVEQKENGEYTIPASAAEVDSNTYTVIPGVALPKDPFVRVNVSENLQAYLFIEVADTLPDSLTWAIDGDNWAALMDGETQVTKDNHPIYVYNKAGDANGTPFSGRLGRTKTNIIKEQKITVAEDFSAELAEGTKLEFSAHLCQAAGFTDALTAWNSCFAGTAAP